MNTSFLAPARLAPFFFLTKTIESATFPRRGSTRRRVAVRVSSFAEWAKIMSIQSFEYGRRPEQSLSQTTG